MNELFEISFKHAVSSPTDTPEYLVVAEDAEKAIEKLREYLREKYRLTLKNAELGITDTAQRIEGEFRRINELQLHRLIGKGSVIC
jgi:hypothetical protein